MRRFVVLRHDMPKGSERGSHYDFMLECESSLRTWAVDKVPTADETIAAIELPDHRIAYLEFQGPVSRNRGTVRQVDHGSYKFVENSDERIKISIVGQLLDGVIVLDRRENHWRLSYQPSAKRSNA